MESLLGGNDLYYKCSGINTYMWNLKQMVSRSYLQSRNRDTEIENKHMDPKGGIYPLFFGFPSHFHVCVCACVCVCVFSRSVMSDSLLSHGLQPARLLCPWIFQTRILEYWSRLPFPTPRDLPNPGIKPTSPALQANSLPLSHLRSPFLLHLGHHRALWCSRWYTVGSHQLSILYIE